MKEYFDLKLKYKKPPISRDQYIEFIEKVVSYNIKDKCKPLITFLIVAYNEDDLLLRLLNSITGNAKKSFEILLVDNGLSYKYKKKLESYSLKHIILNRNIGCGSARNVGSLYSDSDILFFVDADGLIKNYDSVFEKAKHMLTEDNIVAIRGKVEEFNNNILGNKQLHYNLGNKIIPSYLDAECITLIKSKDFISVGGFEDGLPGHEGRLLSYRMVELYNYDPDSFIYDPEIKLLHNYSNGIRHLISKKRKYRTLNNIINTKYPFIQNYTDYYKQYRIDSGINGNKISILHKIINKYLYKKVDKLFFKNLKKYNSYFDANNKENNFTVVILCHNIDEYLLKTIEEIKNQTLSRIEIIVADIGSNENENVKIPKNISNTVRILSFNEESDIKREICKIGSEYICILNKFDYIEPTYLERVKNIYDNYDKAGVVLSTAVDVQKEGLNYEINDKENIEKILAENSEQVAACFRKNVLIKFVNGDLLTSLNNIGNWLNMVEKGWKIKIIPSLHKKR